MICSGKVRWVIACLVLVQIVIASVDVVVAEDASFRCDQNQLFDTKRAEIELIKVQNDYAKVKTLRASFHQRSFAAALEMTELSSGEVYFLNPGKMRWHYKHPEEQIFVVKEETLMLYQKTENQVIIDRFSKVLISDLPVSFLMGLGDLQRDFRVESGCKNVDGIVLHLIPSGKEQKDQQLSGFSLLVEPERAFPKGVKIVDVGGNQTTIWLSDIVLNSELGETLFELDYPKGADLVDRR